MQLDHETSKHEKRASSNKASSRESKASVHHDAATRVSRTSVHQDSTSHESKTHIQIESKTPIQNDLAPPASPTDDFSFDEAEYEATSAPVGNCVALYAFERKSLNQFNLKVILWGVSTPQRPKNCDNSKTTADKNLKFFDFYYMTVL